MFEFALPFSDVFRNYEIEQDCFYRIEKDEDEQVFFGLSMRLLEQKSQ